MLYSLDLIDLLSNVECVKHWSRQESRSAPLNLDQNLNKIKWWKKWDFIIIMNILYIFLEIVDLAESYLI